MVLGGPDLQSWASTLARLRDACKWVDHPDMNRPSGPPPGVPACSPLSNISPRGRHAPAPPPLNPSPLPEPFAGWFAVADGRRATISWSSCAWRKEGRSALPSRRRGGQDAGGGSCPRSSSCRRPGTRVRTARACTRSTSAPEGARGGTSRATSRPPARGDGPGSRSRDPHRRPTPSHKRARQIERPPDILLTTVPSSSRSPSPTPEARDFFANPAPVSCSTSCTHSSHSKRGEPGSSASVLRGGCSRFAPACVRRGLSATVRDPSRSPATSTPERPPATGARTVNRRGGADTACWRARWPPAARPTRRRSGDGPGRSMLRLDSC